MPARSHMHRADMWEKWSLFVASMSPTTANGLRRGYLVLADATVANVLLLLDRWSRAATLTLSSARDR